MKIRLYMHFEIKAKMSVLQFQQVCLPAQKGTYLSIQLGKKIAGSNSQTLKTRAIYSRGKKGSRPYQISIT